MTCGFVQLASITKSPVIFFRWLGATIILPLRCSSVNLSEPQRKNGLKISLAYDCVPVAVQVNSSIVAVKKHSLKPLKARALPDKC